MCLKGWFCKTSEIKKVMLLQANIDLGLESTTACAKLLNNPNKNKKQRTHIFVYLLSATSFGTIFPDFMQTKNSKNIATKLDRTWWYQHDMPETPFWKWRHFPDQTLQHGNCSEQNVFHECWQIKRCCGFYLLKNAILLPMILVEFNFLASNLEFIKYQIS